VKVAGGIQPKWLRSSFALLQALSCLPTYCWAATLFATPVKPKRRAKLMPSDGERSVCHYRFRVFGREASFEILKRLRAGTRHGPYFPELPFGSEAGSI
jgi:hypothetical protein